MKNCVFTILDEFCRRTALIKDDTLIFKKCTYPDCEEYFTKDFTKYPPSRYISKTTRYEVLKRQDWHCNICGKHLKYSEKHEYGEEVAHIDHIHPFSQWESYDGDINEPCNLEALCPECNMKKHSKNGF